MLQWCHQYVNMCCIDLCQMDSQMLYGLVCVSGSNSWRQTRDGPNR